MINPTNKTLDTGPIESVREYAVALELRDIFLAFDNGFDRDISRDEYRVINIPYVMFVFVFLAVGRLREPTTTVSKYSRLA